MYGQYIADGDNDTPVLLLGEVTPSDAGALIAALEPLAAGRPASIALHELPAWHPDGTVRVDAVSTARDEGCAPLGSPPVQVRCAFRTGTWDQIIGLLAPFAAAGPDDGHRHQYLSHQGPVTWIVSTDSTW